MSPTSKVLAFAASLCAALWISLAQAADPPGARPGDDKMTCEEITAELMPYVQQMRPTAQAAGDTAKEMKQKSEKLQAEEAPKLAGLSAASIAAGMDPTGLAQRGVNEAIEAEQKAASERAKAELQPLADQQNGQVQQMMAQAQALKADPRFMHLMDLGHRKGCDKKKGG